MGEKEIVVDGGGTGGSGGLTTGGAGAGTNPGTTGGGSTIPIVDGGPSGGPAGGGHPRTTSGGGGPQSDTAGGDPCGEIQDKANELLKQLGPLRDKNRDQYQRALRAFYGSGSKIGGYAEHITSVKNIGAVVDGENVAGKTMINVGLFLAGGYGGVLREIGLGEGAAEGLDKVLGKGIASSKSTEDALKAVTKKVQDQSELTGEKPLNLGDTPWSEMEAGVRKQVLDGLGDLMKNAATNDDARAARTSYADYYSAALAANLTAEAAANIEKQLNDLNAQAKAKNCPEIAIPQYGFMSFTPIGTFGQGMTAGEDGPTMKMHTLGGGGKQWDLFGERGHEHQNLPF